MTPTPLRAFSNPNGYDFLVSEPRGTGEARTRPPLILFLHGAGERGSELSDLTRQGLTKLLAERDDLSAAEAQIARQVAERFVVVAPQCPQYEVWNDDAVLRLLDRAVAEFNVDPARIYFTGLSMGGFGVWSTGLRHAQRFAALVPICGGGRISDVTRAAHANPQGLQCLGVWAFHGARDLVVPVEESERMVAALREAGVQDVKLTLYPECEHDSWSASYANPELYEWLLRHAR